MIDIGNHDKGTILVVDDTAASLKLVMDILAAEGYEVRPANSGELALASVAARPPDLILLDIRMPGMDGLEVCRRLKARAETCDIPVLFLSAVADVPARVEGLRLGAVDFISKPFQRDELLARVRTHLELSQMRAQLVHQAAELRVSNERLQVELAERRHAEEALRARTEQLGAIGVVSAEVTRELDLARLLRLIHRRAVELLGARAGFVLLYDESTQTLIPRAWEGHGDWVADLRFRLGEGVAGKAAERRCGMVVNDYRTSAHTLPLVLAQSGVTAVVVEPLLYRDRLVGVVTVDNHGAEDRRFTERDRELLALFAGHAAIAIENARLHEAAVHRGDEMGALLGASQAIESSLALPERLRAIVEQAAAIARSPIVRLFLLEEGARCLRCTVGVGFPLDVEQDLTIPVGESLSGRVAVTGEPLAVADTRLESRTHYPTHVDKYGVVSYLGLPVKFQKRLFGVLVFNTPTPRTYAPEEIAFLAAFAQQAAVAIQNARLYEAAQRDLEERRQAEAALEQRTRQLEAVRAVSAEITRELDLPQVLELITKRAVELVGASSGVLRLWDDTQRLLVTGAWTGVPSQAPMVGLRLGEGVSGEAGRRQEALYVNDFRTSPYAIPALLAGSAHTAVMAAPLLYRERLVGVLSITRMAMDPPFTGTELDTLTLLVPQAAIAIENARLYAELNNSYAHLEAAKDELVRAEKLRALGQMAAGVAHDLNNMLAAILGQAELLQIRVKLPEVQEALKVLYTAASDGAQVVRRLQEFGRQQPTNTLLPCDMAPIVHEALELTRPRWQDEAQRQGRDIQVFTALDDLPRILGHPAELREALTNLILNAVDAMPNGGALTLAGHRDPVPPTETDRAGVCVTLTDTGIGMSEEVRRHIFDPFYTTKGVRGTGLGLAVVYGIMERHGGHIDVTSTPGQGTTFTLRFQAAPSGAGNAPATNPTQAAAPRRILLIDDEAVVRNTVANLLRAGGHVVVEAESGAAGVADLAVQAADLVITDLGMPEMTGWEVAQRVKAAWPTLPVVLLTGWGQQISDTAPGRECVDRVLGKPIRLEDLQATIAGLPMPETIPHNGA
jgi:DNA-binding response OmpR family regulator/signal transduction histidine kinase